VFPTRRLDSRYSINTTDICPVGALTSKRFRFAQRVWFLNHTRSICPHCSTGCPVILDHRRRHIYRMMPGRKDDEVAWLCDPGRLGYDFANDPGRPQEPVAAVSDARGQHAPVDWTAAIGKAVDGLRQIIDKAGPNSVGVIFGNWATNEEAFALLKLFRGLGSSQVVCHRPLVGLVDSGPPDGILIREDKNPNTRGVSDIITLGKTGTKPLAELVDSVMGGKVRALWVLDPDLLSRVPEGKERKRLTDALRKLKFLIVSSPVASETSRMADLHLPGATWAEKEGTYTSVEGLVQKIRPAFAPPGKALVDLEIIRRVAEGLGVKGAAAEPSAVFGELAIQVASFKGIQYADLEDGPGRLKVPDSPAKPAEGGSN
jgi:NADH-quinone oxidoreductase subunit G